MSQRTERLGDLIRAELSELLRREMRDPRVALAAVTAVEVSADLAHATVKDLVDTLHKNGESHCLVVEGDSHSIRGLIAASDVERRLHVHLPTDRAPTFAEIFSAVHR